MINDLFKISNSLQSKGLTKEANELRHIIATLTAKNISMAELEQITGKDLYDTAKNMLVFDLILETDERGKGNVVKAIPKLHDKWTDGLILGDASQYKSLMGEGDNESEPTG